MKSSRNSDEGEDEPNMRALWSLIVMPRSRSMSMLSRSWFSKSLFATVFVSCPIPGMSECFDSGIRAPPLPASSPQPPHASHSCVRRPPAASGPPAWTFRGRYAR
eukprot:1487309-Rhodomonas_salina.1